MKNTINSEKVMYYSLLFYILLSPVALGVMGWRIHQQGKEIRGLRLDLRFSAVEREADAALLEGK